MPVESVRRFTCDNCGKERLHPGNEFQTSFPAGWRVRDVDNNGVKFIAAVYCSRRCYAEAEGQGPSPMLSPNQEPK